MTGILEFDKTTGGFISKFIVFIGGLTLLGKALAFLLPIGPMFGGASALISGGFTAIGGALRANAMNFVKGGGALLILAAGVGALMTAFGLLAGTGIELSGSSLFGLMSGFAGGLIVLGGAFLIIGAIMATGYGAAALTLGLKAVTIGLLAIGGALSLVLATMNVEKLKALGQIFSGMGDMMVNFQVGAFIDAGKFLKSIKGLDASVKPVLGDLALIATGQTAQNLNQSATNYDFTKTITEIENIFKPNVKVYIGDEEFTTKVKTIVNRSSQD